MPEIDTPLLLDFLLGLIILLFVPFGVRRGVAKEAMVSAGILLGAAIAERWAERWGGELAAELDLGRATAKFIVAAASLFGGAFVLGYGGSAALGRVEQGVLARLVGGLLAALNGAALLGFLLRYIERYLRPDGTLEEGVVSRFLVREFDWILLGAAGLLALCVVGGLIVTSIRGRRAPRYPVGPAGSVPQRQRPVRVAPEADAGKVEPTSGPEPRPGRFGGGHLGQTAPVLERPAPGAPQTGVSADDALWSPRPANGATGSANGRTVPPVADDWLRRGAAMTGPSDVDRTRRVQPSPGVSPSGSPPESGGWPRFDEPPDYGGRSWRGGSAARDPADRTLGDRPSETHCPTCGAVVGSRDVFCPECGTTL